MLELWLAAAVLLFTPWEYMGWALLAVFLIALPGLRARWGGAPFVPTPTKTSEAMLRLGDIKQGETVVDLGCGDGRLVRMAAKKGANAIGIEASLLTYLLAKILCIGTPNTHIRLGDLWKGDYRSADVLFCYLLVKSMERFEREIWPMLKPGARVVSHSFRMKNIEPIVTEGGVYLYRKS